jgi:SNF2 family DNA or RNA helicase
MPTTLTFKPWQVTGILATEELAANIYIRGCIVADATGLGKTMQIMGYWYRVSCT